MSKRKKDRQKRLRLAEALRNGGHMPKFDAAASSTEVSAEESPYGVPLVLAGDWRPFIRHYQAENPGGTVKEAIAEGIRQQGDEP